MDIIKKRKDFVRASAVKGQATTAFVLQARRRDDDDGWRVGFTCSKKVGNAVARNRAKRRLREVARLALASGGQAGWDYVLIARRGETLGKDFRIIVDDLVRALRETHCRC